MAYPISDVPRRIVYSGSAGVGPYAFTFEVLANTDIAVYKNTTLLTLTTDYTVSINTGTGTGTVTLVVAATASDTVTIVGDRAIQRTSDFVTGGDLFANTLNEELDAQTIYTQQVDEKADRAIKIPVTDPTNLSMTLPSQASRAQKLLGFNASGEPTAYVATTTVSDTSLINFTQSGTGAVTRTAQAKMRDVVSVKDFGAVGDGVADDTAAIQAAINTGAKRIDGYNSASTAYLITNTLTLGSGQILDFGGSSIVAGASATGLLASDGTHIRILNASNSAVRNLVVLAPLASIVVPGKQFQPAVVISTSSNCILENITDQSGLGLAISGVSNYNKITKCWTNGWLYYTYNGGNYNTVSLNTVQSGQIRGTGNAGVVVGNVVDSNTVIQPTRMGIEDWCQPNSSNPAYGVVTGTRITNNTIIGGASVEYFAISAVSPLAVIESNTVYNWPLSTTFGATSYTIELMRDFGITATNNKVYWDNGVVQRVFQEVPTPAGATSAYDAPNIVSSNTAINCGTFFYSQGDVGTYAVVSKNTVRDCRQFIFSNKQVIISENIIELNVAPTATRVLMQFNNASAAAGSVIRGNLITYSAALNGSSFAEFTIYTTVNDLIIDGNVVNGNNITAGGSAVTAIISNGQATTGMKAVNNIFLNGVRVDYGFMTNYVSANNTIPTIVNGSFNRTSFYDLQTLVTKQTVTGSRGANAALASLLTALANAGLITDSTT